MKLSGSLSKFLPAFTKRFNPQPNTKHEKTSVERRRPRLRLPSPTPVSVTEVKEPALQAASPPPQPLPPPPNPVEMLDSIAKFLPQHLICDEHQLTILTLWIVHTWSFRNFPTAAYLHIRAADSQSAKTLCLKLLAALCDSPWLATGSHWRSIMDNLLIPARRLNPGKPFVGAPPQTILLDDCHHTFAPAERQPVLALLNSGSQADCTYVDGFHRYSLFGPKAFAGNAPLPKSLAARCIPIVLRRKKPSDQIARFNPSAANIASLAQSLASWSATNSAALAKAANQGPPRLPAGLSAREQDCAEPLFHIANLIGGAWPDRLRGALVAAFKLSEASMAVELLGDIRAFFFLKDDPPYLSTKDLLTSLTGAEFRPWAGWRTGSGGARKLSQLLYPFGVCPRDLHSGSGAGFRGYLREAFLDAWERYLPPIPEDWHEYRRKLKNEKEKLPQPPPPAPSSPVTYYR